MAVTTDIVATWRHPGAVMRRLLSMGRREDRALAVLIAACFVIFVAQWPRLSREAYLAPEGAPPLEAVLSITFFAMMMIWPLAAYAVAAITHLLARILGGRGTWYSARLALFWSLLATSPAWLFHGLVAGFVGPGPAQTVAGVILLVAFLAIWGMSLREAQREPEADTGP
ncbi:YIP1 family protein [Roseicyclus mahoneyensis]|uniref:Yip1-like protein n=1 Tax=Roseicyclus mahoneyensis TaxID=164332 RepID=A0A316GR25_9RHOB|nr:YIP1 family protein [Roseicyclus mahoneyensis]PWK62472.1 Yip1-like protein [Roseicyclus mahoneyensis]